MRESAEPRPTDEWLDRSRRTVAELPPGLRTVDVMCLSLDALQGVVTGYRLAGYPPALLVTIPRDACRTSTSIALVR